VLHSVVALGCNYLAIGAKGQKIRFIFSKSCEKWRWGRGATTRVGPPLCRPDADKGGSSAVDSAHKGATWRPKGPLCFSKSGLQCALSETKILHRARFGGRKRTRFLEVF
jgi:hypothetical protein